NDWWAGSPGLAVGPGDVYAAPNFVNPGANDPNGYKLQTGSPGLGQGIVLAAVVDDFFGTPRTRGDIGAYTPPTSSPPPIPPPPTPPPVNPAQLAEQQYVARLFQDLLGRAANTGEIAGWTATLDAGTTRSQVVSAIE